MRHAAALPASMRRLNLTRQLNLAQRLNLA
jgi:hypothetical protein